MKARELPFKASVMEAVFRNTNVGIVVVGRDSFISHCNETYERILGYGPGELVGKSFRDFTHPDDMAASQVVFDSLKGPSPPTGRFEKRYLKKDGSEIWVAITCCFLEGDSTNLFSLALVEDISERKAAIRALYSSNQTMRELTENISEVFWMTDPIKNSMIYISPAYEGIWGRTCASLYERPMSFVEAIHPDDQPAVFAAFPKQTTGDYDVRYRVVRPDGSVRWVRDRAFPIRDPKGVVYRVCGIAADVTLEVESKRALAEQEAKLHAASKMSTLGEMAGGIAHEVNNPLAIIQLKTEQLIDAHASGSLEPEILAKHLATILATTKRITKTVKSLKSFARDGEADPFAETKLAPLVDETLELCRERFRQHAIELRVAPVDPELGIECRAIQVSQTILNLLNNAHDAIELRKEKWIHLEVFDRGANVEIRVTDSGDGIPAKLRREIFRPFFTTKEIGKGTGLGLSIVKGVVESHRGAIEVDAASPNTSFVVTLPKRQTAARAA